MRLSKLPYKIAKKQNEIVSFTGLNFIDNYQNGAVANTTRISTERYPYFTANLYKRDSLSQTGITSLSSAGEVVYLKSGKLYRIHEGTHTIISGDYTISSSNPQFVQVHNRFIVWPDKIYVNLLDWSVHSMEDSFSGTFTFTTNTVNVGAYASNFSQYDQVSITGGMTKDLNILSISGNTFTFPDNSFTAGTYSVTIKRKFPQMDYVCEYQTRLWGCSSSENMVYSSVQENPLQFYNYVSDVTGAYGVEVSSEGVFTGCTKLGAAVLFFKENKIHKILGTMPQEYQLYDYIVKGVKNGCYRSLQTINDVLFYVGVDGVYSYNGGTPQNISTSLGDIKFSNAVSGKSIRYYWLSTSDKGTLQYDLNYGMWVRESDYVFTSSTFLGGELYTVSNGNLYKELVPNTSGGSAWEILFKPFYETITGSYNRSSVSFSHKRYRKLIMRAETYSDTKLNVEVKYDDGQWKTIKKSYGKSKALEDIVIPIGMCDKFQVKLSGEGRFTLLGMEREYSLMGD